MSFFGGVCRDVVLEILLFLEPKEVANLSSLNKEYRRIFEDDFIWKIFYHRTFGDSTDSTNVEVDKKPYNEQISWKRSYNDFYNEINWSLKPVEDITSCGWKIETDHKVKTASITKVGRHTLWMMMNRILSSKSSVQLTVKIEFEGEQHGLIGMKLFEELDEWTNLKDERGWRNSYPKSYCHDTDVLCMTFGGRSLHEYPREDTCGKLKKGGKIGLLMKDERVSFFMKNNDQSKIVSCKSLPIPKGNYRFFIISSGYSGENANMKATILKFIEV